MQDEKLLKESGPLVLFAQNEEKIARLYELYAENFPEYHKMWSLLASEEHRHVAVLRKLEEDLTEHHKFAAVRDHGWQILLYVRDFIDDKINEAQADQIDIRAAINNALSLEQSMVEKKSFEVFLPLSEEMAVAMEKLNRETDGHARRLEKALAALT